MNKPKKRSAKRSAKTFHYDPAVKILKGDAVRIRRWLDMFKEFRLDNDGAIDHPHIAFVEEMRKLCGRVFKVVDIGPKEETSGNERNYELEGIETDWFIARYMLETSAKKSAKTKRS